jgi:hypothetical protein
MALTKSNIRVIYIAMRILENALPYQDDVEEVIDMCKGMFNSSEIMEMDDEIDEIISTSEELKDLATRILE